MGALLAILAVLFLALVVIIPLVERYGKSYSGEDLSKLTRWIIPLILVLMVMQLLRYLL